MEITNVVKRRCGEIVQFLQSEGAEVSDDGMFDGYINAQVPRNSLVSLDELSGLRSG